MKAHSLGFATIALLTITSTASLAQNGKVFVQNRGAFIAQYTLQCANGYETRRTGNLTWDQWGTLCYRGVPPGTQCWAKVYVVAGKSQGAGDNVTVVRGGTTPGNCYISTGTTFAPHFSLTRCITPPSAPGC